MQDVKSEKNHVQIVIKCQNSLLYVFFIPYQIYIYIYISAVKRLITINGIQNNVFVYINVCMCTVYIYYVYINTHTYSIYFEKNYMYIHL